jgi:beta-N-acetylhexosaminidase
MTSSSCLQAPVVLDIAGPTLDRADRRRLAHPLTGGMILFARHWVDRRQLTALVAEAKSIRPDLLVCVDHEGGRVQRFRTDGFTHLPPMRVLGEQWMRDAMAATDAATAVGYVLGAELRACGVDLSFTPVLDLDHGPSGVIGDRAFHRDARVVTLLACCAPAWRTAASTSRATATWRPTAMWTCRWTADRSRRSWPTMPSPISGCPPA